MNDELLPPTDTAELIRETMTLIAGCVVAIVLLAIVTYLTTPL